MENDYLWDKTGDDKEIGQMENALKSFRYQPTTPPILPVKVFQVEEKPKFSFFTNYFRFAMVGFACLTILAVGLGIFLKISNNKITTVADLSKPIITPIKVEIPNGKFTLHQAPIQINRVKSIPKKSIEVPRATKIVSPSTELPKIKVTKIVRQKSQNIQLTAEEQSAYDQLMLALSITGSKLKEVKDRANGIEEITTSKNTFR